MAAAPQDGGDLTAVRDAVGFEPPLGDVVPMDLTFTADDGRRVTLAECAAGRPTVLALVYYRCPMLCHEVIHALERSVAATALVPGEDYSVILASIDPTERCGDAARRRAQLRQRSAGRAGGAGWSLLTGDQASIRALADAVGFRYCYVEETGEYAHASGISLLGPGGVLTRAFRGIDYPPRDLRLALVETSRGEVGSLVDRLLLLCYRWEPSAGRYGLAIATALRVGGLLTVVGLGGMIVVLLRRQRRAPAP